MPSISGPRLPRGLRRRTSAAVAALATAAVVTGLTVSPASSQTPSPGCPLAYPVSEITKDQAVTGLTVSSGTTPESFSGQILGVIHDGIAPGLDMIMAKLTSPEIDRVGIWEGMSGSPVYAADGTLIGAVSYGLASGPSPVAGITPASEMYRLLSDAPQDPTAATTLKLATGDRTVAIPEAITNRLAGSGLVARTEASAGMTRLPLPLSVSGMVNAKRLGQVAKALNLAGVRVHQGGAVTDTDEQIPIVAGGNLAASLSYGDVSAIGVGTATAVCGDEVLAFGHPMNFTGASTMTMHGADTVYVQEDPLGPGFKMANATAPVGGITKDRLAGLLGVQRSDAIPATTDITSDVTVPGDWSREGTTKISVPAEVPDISAFHLLADQDRVFDGIAGGSATVGWTVTGKRADGRTWTLTRTDEFASQGDLSYDTVFDLYDALAKLQFNDVEHITIDTIHTSSVMSHTYDAYKVAKVRALVGRRWVEVRRNRPLFLRPGITKKFRISLTSDTLPAARVEVKVPVPENIGMKSGVIRILGGNESGSEDQSFSELSYLAPEPKAPASFDALLRSIRREPRNDQVLADLILFRRNGSVQRTSARSLATGVVNGGVTVPVQGVGMPSLPRFLRR